GPTPGAPAPGYAPGAHRQHRAHRPPAAPFDARRLAGRPGRGRAVGRQAAGPPGQHLPGGGGRRPAGGSAPRGGIVPAHLGGCPRHHAGRRFCGRGDPAGRRRVHGAPGPASRQRRSGPAGGGRRRAVTWVWGRWYRQPRPVVDYRGRSLAYGDPTHVMGILYVTPDSFSDGGLYLDVDAAVARARAMVEQGAAVIDVGAESANVAASRPRLEEELGRLLPVIQALVELPVLISVDTYKADVAEAVLAAGAHIINDISGLRADPRMAGVVARYEAGVVIMHSLGTPPDLSRDPHYVDVVKEVKEALAQAAEKAVAAGVAPQRIIVDPGIGVGKRTEHNLELLR